MPSLGTNYVQLRARLVEFERDLALAELKSRKSANIMQRTFDGISFKKAGLAVVAFAATATYVISRVGNAAIGVASSFEQMEVKLNTLTRARGKETLEALNEWALEMPVNTRGAVDAFTMMQAMGLNPTIDKMQTLVDVSSVFGEDAMPRVARALGQIQALGKLSAEELNQLAEVGINARKYLSQSFGMTVEELQKAKIPIEKIINSIWEGLDADYSGAAKKAMKSWQGLTATFKSYIEEITRKVMVSGPFDAMREGLFSVTQELSKMKKTGELDVWAHEMARGVLGAFQLIVVGAGFIVDSIHSIRASMDIVFEQANKGIAALLRLRARIEKSPYRAQIKTYKIDKSGASEEVGSIDWALSRRSEDYEKSAQIWSNMADEEIQSIGRIQDKIIHLINTLEKYKRAAPNADQKRGYGASLPSSNKEPISIAQPEIPIFEDTRTKSIVSEIEKRRRAQEAFGWAAYEAEQKRLKEAAEKSFNTMSQLSERTAWAMQENFSNFFFDAITGKLKTLQDYAESVFNSIARAFSDIAAQRFTEELFGKGDWISSIIGGVSSAAGGATSSGQPAPRAIGGPVYSGRTYVVGERGPELLYMGRNSGNVIPNHQIGVGSAPPVKIEVINQGAPVKARQEGLPMFNGKAWVCRMVLEAVQNDEYGMGDLRAGGTY